MQAAARPPLGPDDLSSLFEFLPLGAYRAAADGRLLRANAALVALSGFATEPELLQASAEAGCEWYVDPARRANFRALLARDGVVRGFVSELYRLKTRERVWVTENAHAVRDADGRVAGYEGTVEAIAGHVPADAAQAESERRLREIAAEVPGVVYHLHLRPDGTRRFTFISAAVHDLYGVTPQQVLDDGELLGRMDHPEDHERVAAETAAARREGRAAQCEFRILRADGSVRWVQLASSAVPSAEGGEVRVGVMIDISARKHAEGMLRENDQRWKLALESVGDGIWDWDFRTGREIVSPQLRALYGLSAEAYDNRPETLDALVHPDDRPGALIRRGEHLAGLTPAYTSEHRMRCADGTWRWIMVRGVVIERDADGRPLRMIGTHTDIGMRKDAETLRALQEQAEAAQRAQSAFLSRVSHELRTPLNAIIGFAQLLEFESAGTPRQQTWVKNIVESGRHLLALVNDLLQLSSAQSGQLPIAARAVDVALAMRAAWTMQAAEATNAQLQYVERLPRPGTCIVRADPTRLTQVLSNLLSNAVKYNRPGGRIEVSAEAHEGQVTLAVADTGQGIPLGQLERLFNPFDRLGAQHSGIAGTGLGLALTKQLVEGMGGTISVRSTVGAGSTFTVRLKQG
jgi:PAS domain S-box-containing protein